MTVGELIALRGYLRIVHHVPGRLRVRLSKRALSGDRSLSLDGFRKIFRQFGDVQLSISKATLSAVVAYDPTSLTPSLWEMLIDGSDDDAQSAFEALTSATRG